MSGLNDNPMWEELTLHFEAAGVTVTDEIPYNLFSARSYYTSKYAWTITNPETVEFVAKYLVDGIDPLAGSGYWAYLLTQLGVYVDVYDLHPPGEGSSNHYHKGDSWLNVRKMDAVVAVTQASPMRNLLLSWPPYDNPLGADILKAYRGKRVVYIGEGPGGCCGDDEMWDILCDTKLWAEVDEFTPIQWMGMHDRVTVFDRR